MRLQAYVDSQPRGEIARLARVSGVSYSAVHKILTGTPLKHYAKAKSLSDATGGKVSVAELCEKAPVPRKRAKRASGAAA